MERKYLTITALNRYLKYKFDNDQNLQKILIKAEISNFKHHSRGHMYLTLKDDKAQISAVIFASNTKSLNFKPKDGDKVIVEGHISVYEPYGTYQVYIRKMDLDGIGDLYLAYELLKEKLEKLGLFEIEHKQPLPKYPKSIGVVTSPTGAAVKDIINVLSLRYPLARIIIYPALVQGINSKKSISDQINQANRDNLVDVLIIGRGGGSIEDLWPFNEEVVARSIYASKIPIVSAVGHETDFTISDFVSDVRASTPSHADELCVPNKIDILETINNSEDRLKASLSNSYD
ncbi:MAG: exodeoxyribonuclease VII large subunit, partial [Tenericutes bacterium]|nr:exodeoxyribonuclease VII large subunit [Mycoplasmatota bacterium]